MRLLKDVTLGKGFSISLLAALICVDHFFFSDGKVHAFF